MSMLVVMVLMGMSMVVLVVVFMGVAMVMVMLVVMLVRQLGAAGIEPDERNPDRHENQQRDAAPEHEGMELPVQVDAKDVVGVQQDHDDPHGSADADRAQLLHEVVAAGMVVMVVSHAFSPRSRSRAGGTRGLEVLQN